MVAKKKLLRMGRRNFLRALVGLGVSTSTASAFTQEGLADLEYDPETEVPRIHGYRHTNHEAIVEEGAPPEREPVYAVISREKWRMVESADDVRERVQRRLSDLDPTPLVEIRIPPKSRSRDPRTVVVKHATDVVTRNGKKEVVSSPSYLPQELDEIVKDRFPATMTGVAGRRTDAASAVEDIPVITKEVEIGRSANYYDYEYRTDGVPSGCAIDHESGDAGTLGTYAFDGDTFNYVYVTAGHVADGQDEIYQNTSGDSGDHLASVNDQKVAVGTNFDAAVLFGVDISGAYKFAADSADSYHGPSITGAQTRQALLDSDADGDTVYRQGIKTGEKQGQITSVGSTAFETDADQGRGDSGGPHWVEDSGDALISGIHRGEADNVMDEPIGSRATIMGEIEDDYNLTV